MLTLAQIAATFTEYLNSDFNGAELLKVELKGEQDGCTMAEVTYHGGKPQFVFTRTLKFQWDETDERIYIYFH